jgi:hypothetical protein
LVVLDAATFKARLVELLPDAERVHVSEPVIPWPYRVPQRRVEMDLDGSALTGLHDGDIAPEAIADRLTACATSLRRGRERLAYLDTKVRP